MDMLLIPLGKFFAESLPLKTPSVLGSVSCPVTFQHVVMNWGGKQTPNHGVCMQLCATVARDVSEV